MEASSPKRNSPIIKVTGLQADQISIWKRGGGGEEEDMPRFSKGI
jgi:hypothetical protein